MTAKSLRVISFYGMHGVYFPLLILALRGLTQVQEQSAGPWPGWLHIVTTLTIACGLYLVLGYSVTWALNQAEAAKLDGSR